MKRKIKKLNQKEIKAKCIIQLKKIITEQMGELVSTKSKSQKVQKLKSEMEYEIEEYKLILFWIETNDKDYYDYE